MPDATPPASGGRLRFPLSAPHQTGEELAAIARVLETNWLASVGPEVSAFESEAARALGVSDTLATASGTAALHLALRVLGVGPGDEVLVSTLTFCASVNPILYLGARPVFVDSEARSWNLDPDLLEEELATRARAGRLPKAVVVVHLYGQLADMPRILAACARHGVPVVEDAAEGLGASLRADGRQAGTLGALGFFSFDGSKMITTAVGGLLVAADPSHLAHARKLARQAREPVEHYEHTEIGYNYRMSTVHAALGRAQLPSLAARVTARRAVFARYAEGLGDVEGLTLQPEAPWGVHVRWLSCLLVDPARGAVDRGGLARALRAAGAETRPVWKPMHQQPVYRAAGIRTLGGAVADRLFADGLCLPSSSSLRPEEVDEVCDVIRRACRGR